MLLNAKSSLVAGAIAAVGASACCVGPLVLVLLGVSGTWIGRLTSFERYQPTFTALTLIFLGLAFRKLFVTQRMCASNIDCDDDRILRRQRVVFWLVAVPLLLLLAFPLYASWFLR